MKTIAKLIPSALLTTFAAVSLCLLSPVGAQAANLSGTEVAQWIADHSTEGTVEAELKAKHGDVSIVENPSGEKGSVLCLSSGEGSGSASLNISLQPPSAMDVWSIHAEIFFEGEGYFVITGIEAEAPSDDPRQVTFSIGFGDGRNALHSLKSGYESENKILHEPTGVTPGMWSPVALHFNIKERRIESTVNDGAPLEIPLPENFEFPNLSFGFISSQGGKFYLRNLKIVPVASPSN